MQQLPMAFINIALGGRNPALNQMGKSLSNDDFGQILGSVRDGEDWLQQDLLDHLSPKQLAELQEQLAGGMSLPEAARILLQQQRQAADLPPSPLEPNADSDAEGQPPDAGGLPWPLSQQLPARSPADPEGSSEPPHDTELLSPESLAGPLGRADTTSPAQDQLVTGAPVPPAVTESDTLIEGIRPVATSGPVELSANAIGSTPTSTPPGGTLAGPASTSPPVDQSKASTVASPSTANAQAAAQAHLGVEHSAQSGEVGREGGAEAARNPIVPTAGAPIEFPDGIAAGSVLPAQTPLASSLRALLREPSQIPVSTPGRDPLSIAAPDTAMNPSGPPTGLAMNPSTDLLAPNASETVNRPANPHDIQSAHNSTSASQIASQIASQTGAQTGSGSPAQLPGSDRFAELISAAGAAIPGESRTAALPVVENLAVAGLSSAGGSESGTTTAARPSSPLLPELAVPQRLHEAGWSHALGERLVLMARHGQQVAEIKLNPAHLGPLEVKVSLQQDQASVSFLAQHAPVREALEQAVPRLREMFNQQDLQLVNVDVGQRRDAPAGGGEGSARGHGGDLAGGGSNRDPGPAVEVPISSHAVDSDRRLDLYA